MGTQNSTLKSSNIEKTSSSLLDGKMKVEVAAGSTLSEYYDKEFPDSYQNRRVGIIMHPTSFPGKKQFKIKLKSKIRSLWMW